MHIPRGELHFPSNPSQPQAPKEAWGQQHVFRFEIIFAGGIFYNNDQVNEFVSNIYGTTEKTSHSIKSSSTTTSVKNNEIQTSNMTAMENNINQNYIYPFRYMQSSINPSLLNHFICHCITI